jgi:diguanylate cyclase (GGDEF)-like protein
LHHPNAVAVRSAGETFMIAIANNRSRVRARRLLASLRQSDRRPRSILYSLTALAITLVVPLFAVSAILLHQYVTTSRLQLGDVARRAINNIATTLDERIAEKLKTLEALAASPLLLEGDLKSFEMQLREFRPYLHGDIILRHPKGQQLINTRLDNGAPLISGTNSGSDDIVVQTRRPYISNLFYGAATRMPLASISVPVVVDDNVRYVLAYILPVSRIQDVLKHGHPGDPYSTAISDRNGLMLARSRMIEKFLGKPLPGFADSQGAEGVWHGKNPEGVPVFRQYKRSALTGWLISMGTRSEALEAPLRQSILTISGVALLLVVLGGALAARLARKIVVSISAVGDSARALTGGDSVRPLRTEIVEVNRIGQELASASVTLGRQAETLSKAHELLEQKVELRTRDLAEKTTLLEVTLESMDQGLILFDSDLRIALHNRRVVDLLAIPQAHFDVPLGIQDICQTQTEFMPPIEASELEQRWLAASANPARNHVFEWQRCNGSIIEVRTMPIPSGGGVQVFRDVTETRHHNERIQHLARHDALTGVANRVLLMDMLKQAFSRLERMGGEFAVHLLDLDHFKEVNDTLGHDAGDELLCQVADRLRNNLRPLDIVARLGGDEFAIIQPIAARSDAAVVAQRLLDVLMTPYVIKDHEVNIGVSIGIALAPEHGVGAIEILKSADMALYRAKSQGRSTYQYFDESIGLEAHHRISLSNDLRSALHNDELELHYQLIYSMDQLTPTSAEALVRWQHPRDGMISPAVFIPLAENSGLIGALGEWIMQRACLDALAFPEGISVAVNLSPKQFLRGGVQQLIERTLLSSGLSPKRLEIEITESVLLENNKDTLCELRALRELGVKIALDDFGTGYSSLSYLQVFPFDKIKIDRSFVSGLPSNLESAAIITAIVQLADALNMETTAEGVETPAQLDTLRMAGCSSVQGYLLDRPKSRPELLLVLNSTKCGNTFQLSQVA